MHRWLDSLADPRQQGKVVYPLRLLVLSAQKLLAHVLEELLLLLLLLLLPL